MKVSNRFVKTITHTFALGAPFQASIHAPFRPDEMIVRQITYGGCATDQDISVIQCDLPSFGDGIIGHVAPNPVDLLAISHNPGTVFGIIGSKAMSGQVTFRIMIPIGDGLAANILADGLLMITLEFIQYEK